MRNSNSLSRLFQSNKPVIGMIHFMPLLGYNGYPGINIVLEKALQDLQTLEKGGVNGIMVENNYDLPHKIFVDPESIVCMDFLTKEIIAHTTLPVGVSVLWNDYKAALSIAKINCAKFVRIPVFVDDVRTNYGDVFGNPENIISYRKNIEAEEIMLFTDIHVKHAELLSKNSLMESAKKAINYGSDALIITGKWTSDAPKLDDLKVVRSTVGDFPILIGSGATKDNIVNLLKFANGVIVSTALKEGVKLKNETNVKSFEQRLDEKKVIEFTSAVSTII